MRRVKVISVWAAFLVFHLFWMVSEPAAINILLFSLRVNIRWLGWNDDYEAIPDFLAGLTWIWVGSGRKGRIPIPST